MVKVELGVKVECTYGDYLYTRADYNEVMLTMCEGTTVWMTPDQARVLAGQLLHDADEADSQLGYAQIIK